MTIKRFPSCCRGKLLSVALLGIVSPHAEGACTLASTAGNDVQVCDRGSSGTVVYSGGYDTLIFPEAGTGSVLGNVSFGAGQDKVDMRSGTITGNVSQGAGSDTFTVSAGSVIGEISQGNEPDVFIMSGAAVGSLVQGDGLDTFRMTGGTISRAFEDGDRATMSGGSIGRVDMKLDNNLFDLSGGTILGNLVTGFGRDTILVSGGSIGGVVSVSGGDDQLIVSGGELRGGIRASFGNDRFTWRDGGRVRGSVLMAEGDDIAALYNLNEYYLSSNNVLDGGPGNDVLTLDHTASSSPARYRQWETVNLNDDSRLDMAADTLTLGDSVSSTGVTNVDAGSRVSSASGRLAPFDGTSSVTLNNAGTVDLSAGAPEDTLTVHGHYTGLNGQLLLQSVLGDDTAPSDKLVIAQGRIGGTTRMIVSNTGGLGALTQGNGIEVVQATQGAVSDNTAFSLQNSLSVGAYQYYLFKGGATAGSENNWFLRSAVLSPPVAIASLPDAPEPTPQPSPGPEPEPTPSPQPESPVSPAQPTPVSPTPSTPAPAARPAAALPVPATGTPPLPEPIRGAAPIALYRQEVPDYSVIAPAAAMLALSSLGTFHERQGDQSLLTQTGALAAGWARILGGDLKHSWAGTVSPSLNATLTGYQIGYDLFAWQDTEGIHQRVGLFVAHNRLKGRINGFAGGFKDSKTGRLSLRGDSVGAYWTLIGAGNGYVDAVLMGTRLDGATRSDRGVRLDADGHVASLSIEAGYPLPVSENWVVEPQVQFIQQRIDLNDRHDGLSSIEFDNRPHNTARLGVRFESRYTLLDTPIEPYTTVDIWRNASGHDAVIYAGADRIRTEHDSKNVSLGIGLVAHPRQELGVYLSVDYRQDLDNREVKQTAASLGVRLGW